MSIDRSKALATAQKHLQKGQYDKAIAEYQRILQDDPRDARTLLKLGDLYTRQQRTIEATRTYRRVAEQYAVQGFFLKAVAVYKQILKLDPGQLDAWEKLGEMYEMLSLVSDASATFEQVATNYARTGDVDRSLQAMRKMVQLDPENVAAHIKFAEALSKASRAKEAADAFEAAAKLLLSHGRIDDYLKVAERQLFHRPEDAVLARNLARLYLEREDPKHALAKLQVCFKVDPKHIETLELLAQAFQVLGQRSKTVSVYKEVARIHDEAGRREARLTALRKIAAIDPQDEEARLALASATASREDPSVEIVTEGDAEDDDDDILIIEEPIEVELGKDSDDNDDDFPVVTAEGPASDALVTLSEPPLPTNTSAAASPHWPAPLVQATPGHAAPSSRPSPAPASLRSGRPLSDRPSSAPPLSGRPSSAPPVAPLQTPPPLPRSSSPSSRPDSQIQRLLTECDVFLRYGLYDKVTAQLDQVLSLDPDNIGARERLKALFIKTNKLPEAVAQLLTLARHTERDRLGAALGYLREALDLDPGNAVAQARLRALQASDEGRTLSAPAVVQPVQVPAEGSDVEDDILFFDDDEDAQVDQDAGASIPPNALATVRPPPAIGPDEDPKAERPSEVHDFQQARFKTQEDLPRISLEDRNLVLDTASLPELALAKGPKPSGHRHPSEKALPPPLAAQPPAAELPAAEPPAAELPAAEPPATKPRVAATPPETATARSPNLAGSTSPQTVAAEALPDDVVDALEETDFYAAQGLLAEARATLNDILAAHPTHPVLLARLEELGGIEVSTVAAPPEGRAPDVAAAAPPEGRAPDVAVTAEHSTDAPKPDAGPTSLAPAAPSDGDESFLLAQKLAEALEVSDDPLEAGAGALDVDEVLAQFKKGVEEQIPKEDTATHYDLGIAYMEMGLHDDAIQEFELCLTSQDHECTAHTMIGLCSVAKGELNRGIDHFHRGLDAKHRTESEVTALYFELGNAHELLESWKDSLDYYRKALARDASFRDANERVERIEMLLHAGSDPDSEGDEFDRLFDNMILKGD